MPKKKYFSDEERKAAVRAASKRYREKNPQKMKLIFKKSNEKRREKRKPYMKEYNKKYAKSESGKKIKKEALKNWLSNKDNPVVKNYLIRQKEARKKYLKTEKGKNIYKKSREKYKQTESYKTSERKSQRKNKFKRYHNDPQYKLIQNIRKRLRKWLKTKGLNKKSSMMKYVGCSKEYLRKYLERKFYDNPRTGEKMTWENHGVQRKFDKEKWHIDHIKPFDQFEIIDENTIYDVMNYKNLQPLWGWENLAKSNTPYIVE